jgi:hypothetical protein
MARHSLGKVYLRLCFTLAAHANAGVVYSIGPSDCLPRHMDSSCASALVGGGGPSDPPPPPPPTSYALAGQPASGYWYWGYDFQALDSAQKIDPRFVNRSGRPLVITLSFTVPEGPCGRGCLPGVEFYFDQDVRKRDPKISVIGNRASASVPVNSGDSYGFIIGLWQASDPAIAVTTPDGAPVSPDLVGLSMHPDVSTLVAGAPTICQCNDGSVAECFLGDHYSNGLTGLWGQLTGLYRFNAWTHCQNGGG